MQDIPRSFHRNLNGSILQKLPDPLQIRKERTWHRLHPACSVIPFYAARNEMIFSQRSSTCWQNSIFHWKGCILKQAQVYMKRRSLLAIYLIQPIALFFLKQR